MIFLFVFCGITWEVNSSLKVWYNSTLKPPDPGLLQVGRFLMTAFIPLRVMGVSKLLIWSWFNFGKWYLLRKLSISLGFTIWWSIIFFNYVLTFIWISSVSVVIPPFICSFVHLNLSLQLLGNLVKDLSILQILFKEWNCFTEKQCFLFPFYVFQLRIWLFLDIYSFWVVFLLFALEHSFVLFYENNSSISLVPSAMNLPLKIAFMVSHKFGHGVSIFIQF